MPIVLSLPPLQPKVVANLVSGNRRTMFEIIRELKMNMSLVVNKRIGERRRLVLLLRLFDAPTLNGVLDGNCCTIALEKHDSVLPFFLPHNTELVLN
jgi:hypothetical protein